MPQLGLSRLLLLQAALDSGIQCVILRVGATNMEESMAAQSAISLGPQGSKPANATISKSQVLFLHSP